MTIALTAACPDTAGPWGGPDGAAGPHAQPDGWGAGAHPHTGPGPAAVGPWAAPGSGRALHAGAGAGEAGPKPPGYYWGLQYAQPAALSGEAAAAPSANGSLQSMGAHPHLAGPGPGSGQGPGTGYTAPLGHAQFQGGAGLAHYGAHAPQPAGHGGGGGGDAGFDDTPMSPPEEERGAPPSAPSAAQKPLLPTLSPAPDRDRAAHAAARTAGARAPEDGAGAPDAAAPKRARLHDAAPDPTPNGVCTPAADGAAPPAANGHGQGGADGGAPGAREGNPDKRLAHVAAAAAAVAAGQVRNHSLHEMQKSPCSNRVVLSLHWNWCCC